jgi:alkanesulfonate monooxygenase SsuD/methylene tetrahydromethanopterin reductase-like flavin-dependent oxidoreductase (luciferase family)
VEYCNGWFPIAGRAGDLATGIGTLRRLAEKAGRDPQTISVSVSAARPEESAVREYEKIGVERAVFPLPSAGRDEVLPVLDRYTALLREFR